MRTNNLVEAFAGILFINIAVILIKYSLQKYDNKTTRDSMKKVYQKAQTTKDKYTIRTALNSRNEDYLYHLFKYIAEEEYSDIQETELIINIKVLKGCLNTTEPETLTNNFIQQVFKKLVETGRIIYRNTRSFDVFKLGIKEYLTTQKEKELWENICAVNRDKEGSLLIWQIAYLNYNFLICQQESNKEKAESERRIAVEEMIERQKHYRN